jgi:oligopeptide transport system substrate-binding protein
VLKNGQAVNEGKMPTDAVGARALDDHTLQLTLEHPAPYLPQLLKHQSFFPVPAHVVEKWKDAWTQPGHFVGNGAYRLVDWRLGDYIRLEKNPLFRDADKVCFDRVNLYPTGDVVSAERRVLRGELDINDGVQSSRVARLLGNPATANYVHRSPYLSTYYVIFNQLDVPPLKDVRVRQALSMSIDRAFITGKLMRGGQVPTASFVPGLISGYVPAQQRPKPYWADWTFGRRQSEARRLLALAGYGPAHPLKLEMKSFEGYGTSLIVQAMQADWKPLGIDLSLRQEEGIVALQSFQARDFQVGLVGWIADFNDPLTFLGLMKSDTGAQNYGDYKNPAYDALLDRADHEPDANLRAGYLARAEQLALNDADVGPLYNGVNLNLLDPRITGWKDNVSDIHPIRFLCRRGG